MEREADRGSLKRIYSADPRAVSQSDQSLLENYYKCKKSASGSNLLETTAFKQSGDLDTRNIPWSDKNHKQQELLSLPHADSKEIQVKQENEETEPSLNKYLSHAEYLNSVSHGDGDSRMQQGAATSKVNNTDWKPLRINNGGSSQSSHTCGGVMWENEGAKFSGSDTNHEQKQQELFSRPHTDSEGIQIKQETEEADTSLNKCPSYDKFHGVTRGDRDSHMQQGDFTSELNHTPCGGVMWENQYAKFVADRYLTDSLPCKAEAGCSNMYTRETSNSKVYFNAGYAPRPELQPFYTTDSESNSKLTHLIGKSVADLLPCRQIKRECENLFPSESDARSAESNSRQTHVVGKQAVDLLPCHQIKTEYPHVVPVDARTVGSSFHHDFKTELSESPAEHSLFGHRQTLNVPVNPERAKVIGCAYFNANGPYSNHSVGKRKTQQSDVTLKEMCMKSQRGIFQFIPKSVPLSIADTHILIEKTQCEELGEITVPVMIDYVYNPLEYAFETHYDFVQKFCNTEKKVLFLGMNPGPWGMSQNGVPFGESRVVRDWLKISGSILKPNPEHPKRLVTGHYCKRSEVSGSRFWGFFQSVCNTPETFFTNCFVYNMCPLAFMSDSGKNITPPQMDSEFRQKINSVCDKALLKILVIFNVSTIVGVGKFACARAKSVLSKAGIEGVRVEYIMHPSPLNPAANKGWISIAREQLQSLQLLDIVTNSCSE